MMRTNGFRLHRDDDRGVTLILVAVAMVAILGIAAIVIDIALVRSGRRTNQSVTDFAVTAGVRDLGDGPWAGVCTAFDYLLAQGPTFESLDGNETFEDGDGTTLDDPCADPASHAECDEGDTDTWAVLTATSANGLISVTIESPYDPVGDSSFANAESAHTGDAGDPCEQISVKIFETKNPTFSRVIGADSITNGVRSVARRDAGLGQEPAALILLERHDCNTLQTGGSGTMVIAQAQGNKPGIMQIDSDATGDCNAQHIINGQAAPTIVACSTMQTLYGCTNGGTPTIARDSIVGVYAALVNPGGNIAPPFGDDTYGDTAYVPANIFTRGPVDDRYGSSVRQLEDRLEAAFGGTAGATPPGCGAVVANQCTASGEVWRVVTGGGQCNTIANMQTAAAGATRVWFNCGDKTVNSALSLPVAEKIGFNGALNVTAPFNVPNAREVLLRGRSGGNNRGLDVGNGGLLSLNTGGAGSCATANPGGQNVLAVYQGTFEVGSGGAIRTCDTFTFLSAGGNKVPATSGTAPCPSIDNSAPCADYHGSITITSGATVDWSARDAQSIPFCQPFLSVPQCYDATDPTYKFEDLGLWVEDASGHSINGGGSLRLEGIYFLPNAEPFALAGNGASNISLNAQFIARAMHVTGNGVINLIPDPNDAITVPVPDIGLIR